MLSNKKEKVVGMASQVLVITVGDTFDTPTSSTVLRHDSEDVSLVIRPKEAVHQDSLDYQDIFFEKKVLLSLALLYFSISVAIPSPSKVQS